MNLEYVKQNWDLVNENPLIRISQRPKVGVGEVSIYFCKRGILIGRSKGIFHQIDSVEKNQYKNKIFCGDVSGKNCFGIELNEKVSLPGSEWIDLKKSRSILSLNEFALVSRAKQLIEWFEQHQFCGACGQKTVKNHEGYLACEKCSLVHYPRISPSMIVVINKGTEVLLARSPRFPPGVYSALAGFLEPGESVEQCIHREVFEEVAIKVKNLRYQGSQAWPFPHSLMLGFFAEYDSGEIICEPGEIEDARWWPIDKLPAIPPNGSISAWLIKTRVAQMVNS